SEHTPRLPLVEVLLTLAVCVAFVDESIRKIIPSHPVMINAIKDALAMLAGSIVVFRWNPVISRYIMWLSPWVILTALGGMYTGAKYEAYLAVLAVFRTYCGMPLVFACGYYIASVEPFRQRIFRLFTVGMIGVIVVAYLQETMRDRLPFFLRERLF